MKKVLSVLLAGAMMLGMSVSAFAADITFGNTVATVDSAADIQQVTFNMFTVVRGTSVGHYNATTSNTVKLEAGDVLYFPLKDKGTGSSIVWSDLDKDWKIKLSNTANIENATFMKIDSAEDAAATGLTNGEVAVKVVIEDDMDHYVTDSVSFYFYLYDTEKNTKSDRVEATLNFAGYKEVTLYEDDLDWVITVDTPTEYTYAKGEKAAYAAIDFDGVAYTEFKMYAEEEYVLSSSTKYNKDLSKEYDTDVEVITFRLSGVANADLFFPASKDNKQIVAVVDGELVPVEATFETAHKFANGAVVKGYLVEDAEYLNYAVIDADVEIEVEAEVEAPVEADKANPETGAADFVGAAVAMAVVSVAAAGALALKK